MRHYNKILIITGGAGLVFGLFLLNATEQITLSIILVVVSLFTFIIGELGDIE